MNEFGFEPMKTWEPGKYANYRSPRLDVGEAAEFINKLFGGGFKADRQRMGNEQERLGQEAQASREHAQSLHKFFLDSGMDPVTAEAVARIASQKAMAGAEVSRGKASDADVQHWQNEDRLANRKQSLSEVDAGDLRDQREQDAIDKDVRAGQENDYRKGMLTNDQQRTAILDRTSRDKNKTESPLMPFYNNLLQQYSMSKDPQDKIKAAHMIQNVISPDGTLDHNALAQLVGGEAATSLYSGAQRPGDPFPHMAQPGMRGATNPKISQPYQTQPQRGSSVMDNLNSVLQGPLGPFPQGDKTPAAYDAPSGILGHLSTLFSGKAAQPGALGQSNPKINQPAPSMFDGLMNHPMIGPLLRGLGNTAGGAQMQPQGQGVQ